MFNELFSNFCFGRLKRRYLHEHGLSKDEVEKYFQSQMEMLKKNYPGRNKQWYQEKVIHSLYY
jgi:5-bromo-4-chloroindolyl phosphate hydrolysis protein